MQVDGRILSITVIAAQAAWDLSQGMHALTNANGAPPFKISAQKRLSHFCSHFIGWHVTLPHLTSKKAEKYISIMYPEEREMDFSREPEPQKQSLAF